MLFQYVQMPVRMITVTANTERRHLPRLREFCNVVKTNRLDEGNRSRVCERKRGDESEHRGVCARDRCYARAGGAPSFAWTCLGHALCATHGARRRSSAS